MVLSCNIHHQPLNSYIASLQYGGVWPYGGGREYSMSGCIIISLGSGYPLFVIALLLTGKIPRGVITVLFCNFCGSRSQNVRTQLKSSLPSMSPSCPSRKFPHTLLAVEDCGKLRIRIREPRYPSPGWIGSLRRSLMFIRTPNTPDTPLSLPSKHQYPRQFILPMTSSSSAS
ncbi:hypothetical protein WG66_002450 [Moniliophthora roreri]|nr:hypothetical protein WG66_002450 [Moniliophthora roreri]